jgi:hypothetical protein
MAIVPLAALLSHATESVAAKTGDAAGGLLNATLGNLTELVIALTALRAGEYMLVKASIAGAIVTNTLFVLGTSLLLGGLKHHVQEYNRVGARFQAFLVFLASIALLFPSVVVQVGSPGIAAFHQTLSVALSVLLIAAYGLGMLFSLKTHRELFASAERAHRFGAVHAGRCHRLGCAGERDFCRVRAASCGSVRNDSRFRGFHCGVAGGWCGRDGLGVFGRSQRSAGPQCRYCTWERIPNRALCRTGTRAV